MSKWSRQMEKELDSTNSVPELLRKIGFLLVILVEDVRAIKMNTGSTEVMGLEGESGDDLTEVIENDNE